MLQGRFGVKPTVRVQGSPRPRVVTPNVKPAPLLRLGSRAEASIGRSSENATRGGGSKPPTTTNPQPGIHACGLCESDLGSQPRLAQLVEQRLLTPRVLGSSPRAGAEHIDAVVGYDDRMPLLALALLVGVLAALVLEVRRHPEPACTFLEEIARRFYPPKNW